jgi:chemotaxis protein MotB
MKKIPFLALLSVILAVSFTSCVSTKKYRASVAWVEQLQRDSLTALHQLNDCNASLNDVKADRASLQNKNSSLSNKNNSLESQNTSVTNDLNSLSAESKMTIADQAKRLKNLQDMVQAQKDVMLKLKNTISDALMKYKADELSVYIKDGNVYVSLQEKLLFKSGSDVVDPKGKEALKSLSLVLNNTKDITVIIEGHTDNVPIKTSQFKDNWDLSTARATSILRIMTKDDGFDVNRISASGKGEFHPVKDNDTVEGRASNRRTEIILSPDLKELYSILYK